MFHYRKKDRNPSWLNTSPAVAGKLGERSNSSSDEEYRDVEDSTVSSTQHVPGDIGDDGVDDIAAEAEVFLEVFHKQIDNGEDGSDQSEAPPLPEKPTTKNVQKFLSANEVITYQPGEIRLDSVESDSDGKAVCDDDDCDTTDKDQCWSDHLRNLDIEAPEEITDDWLFTLPLATVAESMKPSVQNLIELLQEKIDIRDPQEEFRQLRNVPVTDECETASMQHNRPKNRFRNVLPCKFGSVF